MNIKSDLIFLPVNAAVTGTGLGVLTLVGLLNPPILDNLMDMGLVLGVAGASVLAAYPIGRKLIKQTVYGNAKFHAINATFSVAGAYLFMISSELILQSTILSILAGSAGAGVGMLAGNQFSRVMFP